MSDANKLAYPLTSADVERMVRTSVPVRTERLDTPFVERDLSSESVWSEAPEDHPLAGETRRSSCFDAASAGERLGGETSEPSCAQIPSSADEQGAVLAIGAFDGLHQGHRALIGACVREARERGARAVMVTFDPDPAELLASERAERRLLDVADRVALGQTLGVDHVVVIPFTPAFAQTSPEGFVSHLLHELGPIASVHVGANFRFGRHGAGDVSVLRALGEEHAFRMVEHPLLQVGGAAVSSTRIRSLLATGDVAQANALLCRQHFIRGVVERGRGEGTSFGFPTANVRCDARSCMPGEGVYACIVTDGHLAWPAAANVGKPPTFDAEHDACFLEANLLGFEGDLYDRELAVIFVEWLRASRPFSSLEELERVVLGNIAWVRTNIGAQAVSLHER